MHASQKKTPATPGRDMDDSMAAAQQATALLKAVVAPMEEEIATLRSTVEVCLSRPVLPALLSYQPA